MANSGKIQTVTGLVDPGAIGITFPHEHLSMQFEVAFTPSSEPSKEEMPFAMETLGWIRQNPYSHKPNLSLLDCREKMLDEMKTFKAKGGSCIVENSTIGLDRDIKFIKEVSKKSGVHIVAGAGYYVDASRPGTTKLSVEEMAGKITEQITVGDDGTDIKCGVIGEVGCTWPLTDSEKNALRASATVQSQLGCGVIIHPGRRSTEAPFEIIRFLQEAGGDISKTVMSHLDRTFLKDEDILEFAKLGSYCEYDLFGIEVSHYQLAPDLDMPSDAERIRRIKVLIDEGYRDNLLIAHDIHTKQRLVEYGGHGFCHILDNVLPMMKLRGFSQQDIDAILIHNPRRWMTFK